MPDLSKVILHFTSFVDEGTNRTVAVSA